MFCVFKRSTRQKWRSRTRHVQERTLRNCKEVLEKFLKKLYLLSKLSIFIVVSVLGKTWTTRAGVWPEGQAVRETSVKPRSKWKLVLWWQCIQITLVSIELIRKYGHFHVLVTILHLLYFIDKVKTLKVCNINSTKLC